MARLSDRIIRLCLFSVFAVGLIIFLSGSPQQVLNGSAPTQKSSYSGSTSTTHKQSPAELTPEQQEQFQLWQDAQKANVDGDAVPPNGNSLSSVIEPEYVRENATFVSLVRNSEIWGIAGAIRSVEDRFNHKYHYDWVFLNEEEFSEEFTTLISALVSGKVTFALVPKENWGYPDFIDLKKAAETRQKMLEQKIIYGDSESYRHMCRFQSGFFFQQEAMKKYKYYWRVEPETKLHCNVDFDVFKFMRENNKDYAFTITIKEFVKTIPTLWQTTKDFIDKNPDSLAKDNLLNFVSSDNGEKYNLCHFWSNFEVANMDFWRGETYQKYFDHLDRSGGFFYERWGDAPVHSIAASLFLPKDRIHFFEEIGYYHGPYNNCPINDEMRIKNKCTCDPVHDFTWKDYSCTRRYFDVLGLEKPKNWEKHTG